MIQYNSLHYGNTCDSVHSLTHNVVCSVGDAAHAIGVDVRRDGPMAPMADPGGIHQDNSTN